ncbi:ABC transporter permease [Microbacterium sp. KSW-18]|uniref:ABC transporter permease n=1 Tax=Microbacterium aquilitoris TaxID=3067307 RepID=A0ABU3GI62_9MICO|nr:ABC transporter permease [Microbacterium sp. KSW-18]MDT3330383.1 ABC transporter permease [Microbacterium sp. KSW-18]
MNTSRLWTIARLDLTQRIRTISWYVLLGVFAVVLVGTTALSFLSFSYLDDSGPGVYSVVVLVTLLLIVLVSPTLSGNSINGDRDAATLAPLQVTQATTTEIVLGKFLAAWLTGLTFAAVAVPFLVIATFGGGVEPITVLASTAILVAETGVVAAFGTALSGVLARPLFSVAATYLVVAALTIGTPIAFGLIGSSIASERTERYLTAQYDPTTGAPVCEDGTTNCASDLSQQVCEEEGPPTTSRIPRFDYVWWILAANPFVILADATPSGFTVDGYPDDLFGQTKYAVRQAQVAPDLDYVYDECDPEQNGPTAEEVVASTVPSWFIGLGGQVIVATLLLWWAVSRTRTPARRLPPGTRIA